ncbi:MAG: universal stress protein [Gemmatimonadetes bacterium]|nr:universal stress protein [Gemmatimonadota bacterium]
MIIIKNILMPTDLSDYAGYALDYAREFASTYGAGLHLLHVLDLHWLGSGAVIANALPQYERDRQAQLNAMKSEIEGIDVKATVNTGVPHAAIVRYARDHDIDLIVLATHGRKGVSHALIGSVAEKVVQMAPCPVLTVKHPEHEFVLP